jgi:hypothetical protein
MNIIHHYSTPSPQLNTGPVQTPHYYILIIKLGADYHLDTDHCGRKMSTALLAIIMILIQFKNIVNSEEEYVE